MIYLLINILIIQIVIIIRRISSNKIIYKYCNVYSKVILRSRNTATKKHKKKIIIIRSLQKKEKKSRMSDKTNVLSYPYTDIQLTVRS